MEKVVRIIALKRYEQPPPGYFHLLPDRIITRIERGEGQPDFWETLMAAFNIRPGLVYAFALSVCGAVTVGIFYSPKSEATAGVTGPMPDSLWAVSQTSPAPDNDSESRRGLHVVNWLGSTAPVTAAETTSAFEMDAAHPVPASFVEER